MWKELIGILRQLIEKYHELFRLNKEKKGVVLALDMTSLEKITERERRLLVQISDIEEKRQCLLKQLVQEESQLEQINRQSTLVQFCPREFLPELKDCNVALSDVVKKTTNLSDSNTMLLRGALTAVNMNINNLTNVHQKPDYSSNGEHYFSKPENKFDFEA